MSHDKGRVQESRRRRQCPVPPEGPRCAPTPRHGLRHSTRTSMEKWAPSAVPTRVGTLSPGNSRPSSREIPLVRKAKCQSLNQPPARGRTFWRAQPRGLWGPKKRGTPAGRPQWSAPRPLPLTQAQRLSPGFRGLRRPLRSLRRCPEVEGQTPRQRCELDTPVPREACIPLAGTHRCQRHRR